MMRKRMRYIVTGETRYKNVTGEPHREPKKIYFQFYTTHTRRSKVMIDANKAAAKNDVFLPTVDDLKITRVEW